MIPTAFFLLLNITVSSVKILFFTRLTYFLFLFFLFLILRRLDLDRVLRTIVGGVSAIVFSYGIIQKFLLFPIYLNTLTPQNDFYSSAMLTRIKNGRIFSIFPLPTLYAMICSVLILFILHYLITSTAKNRTVRIWWGVLLLAGLFNLMLTQSFGGILLLTAGGLVYLLLSGILKLKYLAQVTMVLILFLSITVALRFPEVKEFEPVKLRFSNWVQASRIIAGNPFWGAGLGNYETKVAYFTLHTEAKSIFAHNFFLQFIAECGMIVPLLLLALVFPVRKKLLPADYKSKTIYITIAAVMICYNLIDIGLYFFAAGVIFVISLSQMYPHSKREQKFEWILEPRLVAILSLFILLSSLLAVEAVSDNFRKEADFRSRRKDYTQARSLYERSIALNPFNYKAMSGIAAIPFYSGESPGTRFEKHLDRALTLNPDSAFSNYLKSWYLFHKHRYWDAYYYARTAHEKNRLIHHYRLWAQHIRKNLEAGLNSQNSWETDSQGKIK